MKKIQYCLLALGLSASAMLAQDKLERQENTEVKTIEIAKVVSPTTTNSVNAATAVATYDFTTSASKYYGGAAGAAVLEIVGNDTTWGMIAGDADNNGGIGASDLISTRSVLGSNDYNVNDVDMNSGVGSSDLILIRKNLGKASELPQ